MQEDIAANDKWLEETKQEYLAEEAMAKEIAEAAKAWKEKWPNYCQSCWGRGGFPVYNYPHAPDDYDPCEALPLNTCHRCGQAGLQPEDPEYNNPQEDAFIGPCSFCGWNMGKNIDDACPEM